MVEEKDPEEMNLNLAAALGAGDVSTQCFSIYVPNKDSSGNEVFDCNETKYLFTVVLL